MNRRRKSQRLMSLSQRNRKRNYMENNNQQQIQLKATDEILQGKYSNAMQIAHNKEEFIMDFILVHPPVGQLQDRVITSPAHAKRILKALAENITRYENQFGVIVEAGVIPTQKFGF